MRAGIGCIGATSFAFKLLQLFAGTVYLCPNCLSLQDSGISQDITAVPLDGSVGVFRTTVAADLAPVPENIGLRRIASIP